MKKLLTALCLISLAGCTTVKTYTPAPQAYRLKGTDQQINITGQLTQTKKTGVITDDFKSDLNIYFNGELTISGLLDRQISGDFTGKPYNGKPTAATCSTKHISANIGETRCIIFIDNERAATLTM